MWIFKMGQQLEKNIQQFRRRVFVVTFICQVWQAPDTKVMQDARIGVSHPRIYARRHGQIAVSNRVVPATYQIRRGYGYGALSLRVCTCSFCTRDTLHMLHVDPSHEVIF